MLNSYRLKSHPPDKLLINQLRSVAISTEQTVEKVYPIMSTSIPLPCLRRVAYVTGATHDLGKATVFFQQYILDKDATPQDPFLKSHSMISSLYCSWITINDIFQILQYRDFSTIAASLAIQGHHGSLKRPTMYLKGLDFFEDESRKIFSRQVDSLIENIDEVEGITQELNLPSFKKFT